MNPRSLLYMEWLVGLVTDWGGSLVGWLQVSNGTAWMATGRLISGLDKSSAYWFCYWLSIACHWLLERQTGFMQALSKGRRRRTLCSRLSGTRRETWDLARIQPGRRACNTRRGNVKQGQRERKRLTCRLPVGQAGLVQGLWTVQQRQRGRAPPRMCWRRRWGDLLRGGRARLHPADNIICI